MSVRTAQTNLPDRAAAPCGYHGHALAVDIQGQTVHARQLPLDELVLRRFLGGTGLGAWLLLRSGAAAIDPLASQAPLAIVFSPLVGSPLTTSAKFALVCRSPLTGRFNDALVSSHFALAGKRAAGDALVVCGAAQQWSLLVIDDGRAELLPAHQLRDLSGAQTQQRARELLGPDFAVLAIGPAGERGVRYATTSHDGRHAGRGGTGAVLGAKRIKAIAVRGHSYCTWAHPRDLVELGRDLSRRSFGPATEKYRELGTAANLLVFNRLAALPTRNFQQGSFEAAARLSPEQWDHNVGHVRASCAACTIGCEHLYTPSPGAQPARVEYESLFALGPLCGIDDPQVVLRAAARCDELGLDTISTGGTIAFAMECAERRLLDAPWLRFGSAEALLKAIDEIGFRRALGDALAEGTRRLAERLGGEAPKFAPHVKGLEIPGYEPRALQTMALGFAVATRGADHNRSSAYEADFSEHVDRHAPGPEAVRRAIQSEDRAALLDSLILCKFLRGVFHDLFEESAHMLRLVTGWDCTADELRQTARRVVTARKLFNIRAGWVPSEDTLPERFFTAPLPEDGRARLDRGRLAELVATYNTLRGWTREGYLPEAHLRELDLADV
jgi:aldehyde:ferredoxin oxidoreductase